METTKNNTLVRRLRLKRALLKAQDSQHAKIRSLLFVSGGGMRGVYGAGVCLALHHLRLGDCFDVVLGVSTGAAIGGYFLAGQAQAKLGTTIYYDECRADFVRYTFPLPALRIDKLAETFRCGRKRLNLSLLARHRSEFFVGVTHWDSGKSVLIDAKRARPDPVAAITASLALTFAYPTPIYVNGEEYTDGGMSLPLPLKKTVEHFSPTDILVVSNYSQEMSLAMGDSFGEKILDMLAILRLPRSLRHSFRKRDASWKENIAYAEHSPLSMSVLYGTDDVGILTQNLAKLRAGTLQGIRDTLALFGDTETRPETLMP